MARLFLHASPDARGHGGPQRRRQLRRLDGAKERASAIPPVLRAVWSRRAASFIIDSYCRDLWSCRSDWVWGSMGGTLWILEMFLFIPLISFSDLMVFHELN